MLDATFSRGFLDESGMQKDHVNLMTKGRPGAHSKRHKKFVESVSLGSQPALQALKEMTLDMGYEL